MRKILCLAVLYLTAVYASSTSATTDSSFFAKMPMFEMPSVSPDGKHIAAIYNAGDKTEVVISKFGSREIQPIAALEKRKLRIDSVRWLNNDRVLAEVSQPKNALLAGRKVRIRLNSLFSLAIDGSSTIELKSRQKVTSDFDLLRLSPSLLSILPDDKDHILVEMSDPRDGYNSSIFKVNVITGNFDKYIPNNLRIYHWYVDRSGVVFAAAGRDKDPDSLVTHIYLRSSNSEDWKKVRSFKSFDEEFFYPISYNSKKGLLTVESDYKLNKSAIWLYDVKDGKFLHTIGEAPGILDVNAPIYWSEDGATDFIGFSYVDNFVEHVYLDDEKSKVYSAIRNLFKKNNLHATIVSSDREASRFVIRAESDSSPRKYYLFDKSKKSISFWFSEYPQLETEKLANVEPISFKARDGMEIYGYLSRPETSAPAPLIVFPHGGPHARDTQDFDPWVQMFVNEGFAVLQVNYRGSTGYGDNYMTAGYKQWGKKMQDDVIDAVHWVENNHLANTQKACVVGGSYGGYVALVAGFKTPKMFDCIVSIAGVSDIRAMISNDYLWTSSMYYKKYLADIYSSEDIEDIQNNSPINFTDKFEAPVLLIHGKADTRVSYRQSIDMSEKLNEDGKDVKLILLDDGTHNLNDAVNREEALSEVIKFVGSHLLKHG